MPAFWETAARILATPSNWSVLDLTSPSRLGCFVGLASTQAIPESIALTDFDPTSPAWPGVTRSARPVLLLVQNYLQAAKSILNGKDAAYKKAAVRVMSANMLRIKQATADPDREMGECGALVQALRSALLLLKLVSLLSSLKVEDDQVHAAVHAMWAAIACVASDIISVQADLHPELSQSKAEAEAGPEGMLSVLLVQLLLPVMRPLLKTDTKAAYECICCANRLLRKLMPSSRPALAKVVASELVSKGTDL